jgi:eukaryotic-like serine/threonine-protein kinase
MAAQVPSRDGGATYENTSPARRFDAFVEALWGDLEAGTPATAADYARRFALSIEVVEAEITAIEEARTSADHDHVGAAGASPAAFRIGGYAVLRRLGSGGFADVWLGRSIEAGRLAAIKVLRERVRRSSYACAKFAAEVKLTSQIEHPTICKVFEHGLDDGRPWFAMEFIRGETLARRIARLRGDETDSRTLHESFGRTATPAADDATPRKSAPERDAVRGFAALIEAVARGLHAAHLRGVVHRDVKPGNIMLRAGDDAPFVLDFGLALELSSAEPRLTSPDEAVGTPLYIAPERIRGEADDARVGATNGF